MRRTKPWSHALHLWREENSRCGEEFVIEDSEFSSFSSDSRAGLGTSFPILPILCLILPSQRIMHIESPIRVSLIRKGIADAETNSGPTDDEDCACRNGHCTRCADPRAYKLRRREPDRCARPLAVSQDAPTVCNITSVEPGVSFFAQGKSRFRSAVSTTCAMQARFWLRPSICRFEVRSFRQLTNAPQLAMRFLFDMQSVREVVSSEDLPEVQRSSERRGLALGRATPGLLNAGLRLIELLDAPEDIPFLKHLIERELIYRILQTPQGERLRAIATAGNLSQKTAKAAPCERGVRSGFNCSPVDCRSGRSSRRDSGKSRVPVQPGCVPSWRRCRDSTEGVERSWSRIEGDTFRRPSMA